MPLSTLTGASPTVNRLPPIAFQATIQGVKSAAWS